MQTFFENTNNTGTVVKFVATADNPLYLGGSSSTYDSLNLKVYFGDVPGGVSANNVKIGGKTIAVKARSSEHTLGLKWWKELNPDMPEAFVATDTQYGFVGEVYAVWVSSTNTYSQLALLSEGFTLRALTAAELAESEIKSLIPASVSAGEGGVLNLASSTAHAENITWTSSVEGVIDLTTGEYQPVTGSDITLTLTAHYTVGGAEYTCDIELVMLATAAEYKTVTEALALENGEIDYLKGVVVGFGPQTAAGISSGVQKGVYISDGTNLMFIADGEFTRSDGETDFDKVYVLADGHKIKIGDELYFDNAQKNGASLTLGSAVTLNSENAELTWDLAEVTEIASFADMKTLFTESGNIGKVIKFVGTQDNPLYISGTSSAYDSLNIKFYFGDVEGGVNASNIKIDGKTVVAKARSSEHSLGLLWWQELNPDMPKEKFSGDTTDYGFVGELYAVWTYDTGTSFKQLTLLSEGFTLKALTTEVETPVD